MRLEKSSGLGSSSASTRTRGNRVIPGAATRQQFRILSGKACVRSLPQRSWRFRRHMAEKRYARLKSTENALRVSCGHRLHVRENAAISTFSTLSVCGLSPYAAPYAVNDRRRCVAVKLSSDITWHGLATDTKATRHYGRKLVCRNIFESGSPTARG